ncbi:MAG: ABC transporter ATP-binding protein [Bryobacteraceae bacterium]
MIEAEHLSKTHQRAADAPVHALQDVSFRIEAGEFAAVRGASGSGKSSLLNILGCLDRPTSGVYRLIGEDVSTHSDRQLARIRSQKIGFVFQSFHLLPRTTAEENVQIPMIYLDGRVDRKKGLAALERVGLRERAKHFSSELSGGEQQRVALARALINDPPLILADEPTGNLDQASGAEVMRILSELHREGRTIVLVTHDDAIAAHAGREILLQDGRLKSDRALIPDAINALSQDTHGN